MEPIDLAAFREGHEIELIGERKPRNSFGSSGCQHIRHVVDAQLRQVTCKACGQILDPIECILGYIDFWNRTKDQIERLNIAQKKARVAKEVKDMERMARQVAKQGGVWACSLKTHSLGYTEWYYEAERP